MDQVHAADKASKFASGDFISSMPEIVTTNILDRMPIQEAVRTGILSRNWRFKWTLLTKLVFDEDFFDTLLGPEGLSRNDEWDTISRLLLNFRGPITKFVLYIPYYKLLDVRDINHWVMFLSRKGIEEFTLINMHSTTLKLPTYLLSCLKLRYLKLHNCCISPAPTFHGLPNLLSLDLYHVAFASGNCGDVITQCRLLEILKFSYYHDPIGKMKLVEFAELENLKILSWPLRKVDSIGTTSSIIFQLGSCLPKLQELDLDFRNYKFLEDVVARKWVCNAFPNLMSLTLYPIDFSNGSMVLCTFKMIWGSPNLQTLIITAAYTNLLLAPAISSEVDYNTMGKLKLQRVVFSSFRGSENEVCLIKYLLACSPLLKKMVIHSNSSLVSDLSSKFMFARKLLMLRRASSIAEVELT